MKKQFRIGEIAKMFSIPQSTLRYYDEIGLFKPKYIDPENNYRFYTTDQFVHLDTIIFLRKIGFTIQQIQFHMKERNVENTYQLFQEKLDDVRKEMQLIEMAAKKIEHKLKVLEQGMKLTKEKNIVFKTYPKRQVIFLYKDEPLDLNNTYFEDVFMQEIHKGASPHLNEGIFTGDIGLIVDSKSLYQDGPVLYKGIFKLIYDQHSERNIAYIPEGLYACYPHQGPYEQIRNSYQYFLNELVNLGYKQIGDPIEIGIIDESVVENPEQYLTVIEIPIKKISY
ncbi:MerR family transcriptional regulator [Fervidibacillus halotolerans]|uniref:MerR family transcriptional regulator n=1 Tax=Fervidibacillus halotolerans TaxID=2980027 RepID=A0A9E8RY10_9BACI|nr:MerR family transcriptional regulator [Fervidibacillus halotolerans]WAA13320.1 MerR family transcriptional regulator [Fervidibacillus halotolerans]